MITKHNPGDRVRLSTDGRKGKIRSMHDDYWYGIEYTVDFDDGTYGRFVEKVLVPDTDHEASVILPQGKKCTCGLLFVRHGGKHSDYCDLYEKEPR